MTLVDSGRDLGSGVEGAIDEVHKQVLPRQNFRLLHSVLGRGSMSARLLAGVCAIGSYLAFLSQEVYDSLLFRVNPTP
jgi:hypothetical protein